MARCPDCQHDTGGCNCYLTTKEYRDNYRPCEHNWVFLREIRTYRYALDIPISSDHSHNVYYCSKCLKETTR